MHASTVAATESGFVTSAAQAVASPPSDSTIPAVSSAASILMSTAKTFAPSRP